MRYWTIWRGVRLSGKLCWTVERAAAAVFPTWEPLLAGATSNRGGRLCAIS